MAGRRPAGLEPSQSPVALPHVVITVTGTGALHVAVDGAPFPPPAADTQWTRSTASSWPTSSKERTAPLLPVSV